jgi:hypothetical protein
MQKLFKAEFINQKAYWAKWGKLNSTLKKVFKKSVYGSPDLMGGGFCGEIVITEDKQPDFIRQKTLQFYISILGPFFSIHGIDRSTAILPVDLLGRDRHEGRFMATHAVTVSPAFEYQNEFKMLEDELREYFPGYLFVPFDIGMSTIKNISIEEDQRDPRIMDTIYEALFGQRAVLTCLTRGDKRYGWKDWIKPVSNEEQSLFELLATHVISAPTDTTIHKVWKLQETKTLDSFKITGNLMFGTDTYDVIDLTDKSTMIAITEKERNTPQSLNYKIIDNVITFSEVVSLKIINLTNDSLTLHLLIDFADEEVSAKGAAAEMKFVQMKKMGSL